ncbi:MAG: glycosyltransferase [Planctomycetes bacterium]|jgi:glycosyltransferase involved in cell wall biosynthesis|nr:glycosyltransferase [Phycisphaerae bacterium]NBB95702.1 glycosyltransferase [Planctomycetota bacterium]
MRVFMLGWEFPPFISGGLGTACYGLTRSLDEAGVDVCFVLPTAVTPEQRGAVEHVQLRSPADVRVPGGEDEARWPEAFEHVEFRKLDAVIPSPYGSPDMPQQDVEAVRRQQRRVAAKHRVRKALDATRKATRRVHSQSTELPEPAMTLPEGSFVLGGAGVNYDGDLMGQIHRYARLAVELALCEDFDVIHAHDWMTFPAAMAVAGATGKPLVIHVHSTEFDRSGENINQQVYDVERAGMHAATRVIAVSHLTRNIIVHRYGVDPDRVAVVYNAVDLPENGSYELTPIRRDETIVLFLGRITMQKGPEYFLQAARKVIEKVDKVRFVVAGSGDMVQRCIRLAADLRIGRYVTFTGFLRGQDVDRIFSMADLYVMPSVSEPFGIAPLEAMSHNVPVIISRQSGVSEVLTHVLKVDFWDTDEMANKILAVIRHKPLHRTLRDHGQIDLKKFSWRDSACKVRDIYARVATGH